MATAAAGNDGGPEELKQKEQAVLGRPEHWLIVSLWLQSLGMLPENGEFATDLLPKTQGNM